MKALGLDMVRWPSGDCKPLMEITSSVQDLEQRFGFTFEQDEDDLGPYLAAAFVDPDIGPVLLWKYQQGPAPQRVAVFVDRNMEPMDAADRVMRCLNLGSEDVTWRRDVF